MYKLSIGIVAMMLIFYLLSLFMWDFVFNVFAFHGTYLWQHISFIFVPFSQNILLEIVLLYVFIVFLINIEERWGWKNLSLFLLTNILSISILAAVNKITLWSFNYILPAISIIMAIEFRLWKVKLFGIIKVWVPILSIIISTTTIWFYTFYFKKGFILTVLPIIVSILYYIIAKPSKAKK